MSLAEFALSLTTPAGIGIALSFVVEYLAGDWFHALSMKAKRIVLFVVSVLIAGCGYLLLLASQTLLPPIDTYHLLDHLWTYCILPASYIFGTATVTHGFIVDDNA